MMAFALYIVLEPRECDDKGLDVQRLASFLHRTPSSVALKIWNIAAYDANRKACGRVGMKHGSKLDSQVWQWYAEDPDAFMEQCLDVLRRALLQANASNFSPPRPSGPRPSFAARNSNSPAHRRTRTHQRGTTNNHASAGQPILFPQLTIAELPRHMLHNRHADSQTTDRQSHQTLEGIDAQRENRRIEWAVAQRLP